MAKKRTTHLITPDERVVDLPTPAAATDAGHGADVLGGMRVNAVLEERPPAPIVVTKDLD